MSKNEKQDKTTYKILKVIHGFPPDFMAGSEVYSHTLCKELAKMGHQVFVFTRVENEFLKPYEMIDEIKNSMHIYRINKPKDYCYDDKFYDESIERHLSSFWRNCSQTSSILDTFVISLSISLP